MLEAAAAAARPKMPVAEMNRVKLDVYSDLFTVTGTSSIGREQRPGYNKVDPEGKQFAYSL